MIARSETSTECEQIIALLGAYSNDACVSQVLADIGEVQRLLEFYSFRAPQLADRLADQLNARYRYEIYALYGPNGSPRRQTDSSYLRLMQLLASLVRVAAMRLCCEGAFSLSNTQLTSSDGLLLLALKNAMGRG